MVMMSLATIGFPGRARGRIALTLSLCVAWLSPATGYGWGDTGHQIVALIAEQHLSPAARTQLVAIMGPDGLASVAMWADHFRQGRATEQAVTIEGTRVVPDDTIPWHFVNIPIRANNAPSRYEAARHCPQGTCVVGQVERFLRILGDPSSPLDERRTALRFLVHFVADLHQPLHCAERRHDRGGNTVTVIFFGDRFIPGTRGSPWTLHGVWDSGLIARTGLSAKAYADHLLAWLDTQDHARLTTGTLPDWANEAHRVAATHAYAIPRHRTKHLGNDYLTRARPALDEMLAKAGVRLASMLNEVLSR